MKKYLTGINKRTLLSLMIIMSPAVILCQSYCGRILSGSSTGIGYVNIGIVGKNIGTVSDVEGNFIIDLSSKNKNDSLRFSCIGYKTRSLLVNDFIEDQFKTILLSPQSYALREVKVAYHKYRKLQLGDPVLTHDLRSGFANNDLGSELGIKVCARKEALLRDVNFNVGICTFDTVTYRFNIYHIVNDTSYENILQQPIYITFFKNQINDVIVYDLKKYSIMVKGDILVTLELYKDLGEGKLLFNTQYFTGITYHRKTSQGKWTQSSGVIGMYLNSLIIN